MSLNLTEGDKIHPGFATLRIYVVYFVLGFKLKILNLLIRPKGLKDGKRQVWKISENEKKIRDQTG
jgi:hypothetical protein